MINLYPCLNWYSTRKKTLFDWIIEVKWSESRSVVSSSLRPHRLYGPWNSLGQNTGVGILSLLQGNLPNPGIKPRSPTLQADSLSADPPGKSKNTGVVAYPFCSGSSWPRNWTRVSNFCWPKPHSLTEIFYCILFSLYTRWAEFDKLTSILSS